MKHPNSLSSEVLYRLNIGNKVPIPLLRKAFHQILTNEEIVARDVQLSAFLTGFMIKGPTVKETAALLKTAFTLDNFSENSKHKIKLPSGKVLVGIAGSGKKGFKTFNISSGAALIAAACGAYVAKTVSSSTSSMTGSSDFFEQVGVNLKLNTKDMAKVVQKTGFGAFSLESLFEKLADVYDGKFFAPHALSFGLSALGCPVKFDSVLFGLSHPNIRLSANVLREFNIDNGLVVTSTLDSVHYMDELCPQGTMSHVEIKDGKVGKIKKFQNFEEDKNSNIQQAETKEENIKYCLDVLRGKGDPYREDFICLNAGAILYLSRIAESIEEGTSMAKKAIKSQIVIDKLIEIIEVTNGNKNKLYRYLN